MLKNVYLLCGLGADERLFGYLDLSAYRVTPVKWIPPLKSETMAEYAVRLLPQVTSPEPILVGVSFGGMIAIELGKLISTSKIVLISSSASRTEIPFMYRFAGKLRIHRLFTGALLKRMHILMNWIMGAADPVRRRLLKDMLQKTDEDFLYWAIDQVVTWNNTQVMPNVIRIHGSADKVLPLRKAHHIIRGGGHLIVANRANEVTRFLKAALS